MLAVHLDKLKYLSFRPTTALVLLEVVEVVATAVVLAAQNWDVASIGTHCSWAVVGKAG